MPSSALFQTASSEVWLAFNQNSEAAKVLGIDQPKISALINGKLIGFSTARLFRFLNALGRDVEIIVKPKSHEQAQTRVVAS